MVFNRYEYKDGLHFDARTAELRLGTGSSNIRFNPASIGLTGTFMNRTTVHKDYRCIDESAGSVFNSIPYADYVSISGTWTPRAALSIGPNSNILLPARAPDSSTDDKYRTFTYNAPYVGWRWDLHWKCWIHDYILGNNYRFHDVYFRTYATLIYLQLNNSPLFYATRWHLPQTISEWIETATPASIVSKEVRPNVWVEDYGTITNDQVKPLQFGTMGQYTYNIVAIKSPLQYKTSFDTNLVGGSDRGFISYPALEFAGILNDGSRVGILEHGFEITKIQGREIVG